MILKVEPGGRVVWARVVDQRAGVLLGQLADEVAGGLRVEDAQLVRVVARVRGHRQDRAGGRVERDHPADLLNAVDGLARQGRLEPRVSGLLCLGVDRELDRRALLGLVGDHVDEVAERELIACPGEQGVLRALDAGRVVGRLRGREDRVVAGDRRVHRAVGVAALELEAVVVIGRLTARDRDAVGGHDVAPLDLAVVVLGAVVERPVGQARRVHRLQVVRVDEQDQEQDEDRDRNPLDRAVEVALELIHRSDTT